MNMKIGCWLAAPDIVFVELAAAHGYGTLALDVEHGTFDLKDLDRLIPFARRLGLRVLVKVEGPRAEPIQQALDFGASGVIVPHIGGVEHARSICAAAKYPLLGTRSYAGSRPVNYGAPSDSYFDDDNRDTVCLAMVETADALAESMPSSPCRSLTGSSSGPRIYH
jgi:4-hydroxy-2-oxoheptanedioate aldolase